MSLSLSISYKPQMKFQISTEKLLKALKSLKKVDVKNDFLEQRWGSDILLEKFTKHLANYEKQRLYAEQHAGRLADNYSIFSCQLSRMVDRPNLKNDAEEALVKFHETRDKHYLFLYKKLIREYRSILLNCYREIKKIFKIKYSGSSIYFLINLRRKCRALIKMIPKSIDDEEYNVKSDRFFLIFLTLTHLKHEYTTHKRYHQRSGIVFS